MARFPCHEKKPLKKGAWSPEEDQKLIAYINKYGIWNWSAMPGFAGLSRSGKSCRLRWMNYLRPNIKHGYFSREEEETILKLHEELGNRWSVIASRLPGRTDNEIKNYWHTRLRKCLKANLAPTELQVATTSSVKANQQNPSCIDLLLPNDPKATNLEDFNAIPLSSSIPAVYIDKNQTINEITGSCETLGELKSLWEQPFSMEDLFMTDDYGATYTDPVFIAPTSPVCLQESIYTCPYYNDVGNDLWVNFMMQDYIHGI